MKQNTCEKCGSNKVMPNLKITDFGHMNEKKNLSIHIQTTDRIFFNKSVKSELYANVCGSCSDVELAISNPDELWNAYVKQKT